MAKKNYSAPSFNPKMPSKAANKNSKSEMKPSRHALTTLTKGDPINRSLGQYAKAAPDRSPDILSMAMKAFS